MSKNKYLQALHSAAHCHTQKYLYMEQNALIMFKMSYLKKERFVC